MAPKSTRLSEMLHVCHVPNCTAITMNPYLHQLNAHGDEHSHETKLWLRKESSKKERVIFNYRKSQNHPDSSLLSDTSVPKPSEHASNKSKKKFGNLHKAGKAKKFSLSASPQQSKGKKCSFPSTSFTAEINLHAKPSSFVGIPELSAAVHVTQTHFNRANNDESHPFSPLSESREKESSSLSPYQRVSREEQTSPVQTNNSVLPEKERNGFSHTSEADNSLPQERNIFTFKSFPSDGYELTSPYNRQRKNYCKQMQSNMEKSDASELSISDSISLTERLMKRNTDDSTTSLSQKSVVKKLRMSDSFSSSPVKDVEFFSPMTPNKPSISSTCEVKKEFDSNSERNSSVRSSERNSSIRSSPLFSDVGNDTKIQMLSIDPHQTEVPIPETNSTNNSIVLDSWDVKKDISRTSKETRVSHNPDSRIKVECDAPSASSHEYRRESSPVLFDRIPSNTTTIDLTDEDSGHQDVKPFNKIVKQRDNSASPSSAGLTNAKSPSTSTWKLQLSIEASSKPACESAGISNGETLLYSREHLSYNFVLSDYVRECLSHCGKHSGSLTKEKAMSVQQVMLVLLFLRGALLQSLRELCVCCVMKPITPTPLGTIILKSISSAYEVLELSLKEFEYLKDFVRFVRPVFSDSVYGCVFVLDGGEPFSIESLQHAISMCWNLSKVNVGERDMLRSIDASYKRKSGQATGN